MKRPLPTALAACLLALSLAAFAQQEDGPWRAVSQNARSITGDIALSAQKIAIDFIGFPMVRVRSLTDAELSAAFDPDLSTPHTGSLYKLDVSAAQKFLRKNTLCGSDDTEWMATYASGHSLQLAFFSSQRPPLLTLDALSNSTDLCGTFSYER